VGNLAEIKKNTVDVAERRIREMQNEGELDIPADYSVGNALKSAWLKLQETKSTGGKPVLEACTRTSIVNAMLDTVVQGLSPAKDQVYYIAYGNKLTAMRSYFGSIALAKRVANVKEVNATVIYEGDEIEVEVVNGNRRIKSHKSSWENQDGDKIKGGYVIITFNDDRPDHHTIMTFSECEAAWKQGKTYKGMNGSSPHAKFTKDMVEKTVINKATKKLIKGSSDSYLFAKSVDRSTDIMTEEKVAEQIEKGNASEDMTIEGNAETIYDDIDEPEDDVDEDIKRAADALDEDDNPF